jgi:hypothetical protein
MQAPSIRNRTIVAAAGAIILLTVVPATSWPQPPAQPAQPNVDQLEREGEELQHALSDESRKIEFIESQYERLQSQINTIQGRPQKPKHTTAQSSNPTQSLPVQGQPSPANGSSGTGGSASTEVQASSTSRKAPATSAAVLAAYQQQNALFQPGLTFYPQFSYAYTNSRTLALNGFFAFGAIFLGNLNVERSEADVFTWNPEVYYAFNRHFELDVNVPYLFERSTFREVGVDFTTAKQSDVTVNKWGLGDVSGGFYWQVMDQNESWPSVVWNAQVSAPTGQSPYGIKLITDPANTNLKYPSNLPTGKGVWGFSSGFTLLRQIDPVVLFGSGNYYYELTQHVDDISSTPGTVTPGKAAPGNSMSYTLGISLALNEKLNTTIEVQDLIQNSSEVKADSVHGRPTPQWLTIPDSSGNAAQFIFGASYAAGHRVFPYLQAGIGATQLAPNFQISLWVPYYFD